MLGLLGSYLFAVLFFVFFSPNFGRCAGPMCDSWTVGQVAEWATTLSSNQNIGQNFREGLVDGKQLLLLTDDELENDLRITNRLARARFRREIETLRPTPVSNSASASAASSQSVASASNVPADASESGSVLTPTLTKPPAK